MLTTRKERVFFILAGIFFTCSIVAELISGKLVEIGSIRFIAGLLPWPIVFLLTDILNEFYGKQVVRKLSFICAILIGLTFLILFIAVQLPTANDSYLNANEFKKVFQGSLPIMIGSIVAFLFSQLLDVYLFGVLRKFTNGKWIGIRATVSTIFSQFIDTFTVLIIGFWLPQTYTFDKIISLGLTGYSVKLGIALALTPFVYLLHYFLKRMFSNT